MTCGGLIQIVSIGPQDIFLTANAQITFFRVVYRRHTNFSVESIEQYFNSATNFGKKGTAEVSRNGDLISQILLKVVLPEVKYSGDFVKFAHVQFAWVKRLGFAMIDEIEFDIGGTIIDKQYGDWLNIWYELTHDVGQEYGNAKMIADVPEMTDISTLSWDEPENTLLKNSYTAYIPLQFYFCRNNGLALPLIALQFHQVRISVKFRNVDQCYVASEAFKAGGENLELEDASLFINYIYLDSDERKKFARVTHEYLIEQVQFTGEESLGANNSAKYKLNFNHPIKTLFWVSKMGNYQGGKFMSYNANDWEAARKKAAESLLLAQFDLDDFGYFNDVANNENEDSYVGDSNVKYAVINPAAYSEEPNYIFNDSTTAERFDGNTLIGRISPDVPLYQRNNKAADMKEKVEGVIRICTDFDNDNLLYPVVDHVSRNDLNMIDLSTPNDKIENDNRADYIKNFDVIVWQHTNYGLLIDGSINPVSEMQLQLNGQDRQSKRSGFWYDTVESYMHFSNTPQDGLNSFSFGLNPEEHQPSGTCNFSRIDSAQMNLWFSEFNNPKYNNIYHGTDNKVLIFALNYNVVRIMSGMGGLAYAN